MKDLLIEKIDELAIFVGAGISTLEPSCLPSWWELNHSILESLTHEAKKFTLEVQRVKDYIIDRENSGFLPPEFVSEIITSRIGVNYFEVLRSLESDAPNSVHFTLASLAKIGKLTWIITTNFDTLIEKAFDLLNVPLTVCVNSQEYSNLMDESNLKQPQNCILLKLHGTATIPESCIDTLAQRKQGLKPDVTKVLHRLGLEKYWLFLGYSGADFDAEPNYLGIRSRSEDGKGIFWLQLTGTKIRDSVSSLLSLYGPNGFSEFGKLPDWLKSTFDLYKHELNHSSLLEVSYSENIRAEKITILKNKTSKWASDLQPFMCATILADIGTQAGNYIDSKIVFQTILSEFKDQLPPLYLGITLQELGTIEYHFANNKKALEYYKSSLEPYKEAEEENGYFASIQAIGNILFDFGQFLEAEKIYLEYVEFAKKSRKDVYLFSLKVITKFYVLVKDVDKSLEYLEIGFKIAQELGDEVVRMDLLSSAHQIESLFGNNDEAENQLLEIFQICSRLGDLNRMSEVLINLAQLYWNQNKQEEAFKKLYEAETYAKQILDVKTELRVSEALGKFKYYLGEYEDAERILTTTLERAEEINNFEIKSTIWQNLGLVYQSQGKIQEAIDLLSEAIVKMDKIGHVYRSAGMKNNLGNIFEQQGEIDQALGLYLDISTYYESIGDELNLASANGNIGNIFYRKGIYSEARKHYLKCLETFEKLDYIDGILRTLHNVAGVIYLEGNIEESKKYFLLSIEKSKEFNQPVLQDQFSLSYANVLFQQREFENALIYYNIIIDNVEKRQDNYMKSIVLYSKGLAYLNLEDTDNARKALEESIKVMETLDTNLDIYPEAIKYLEDLNRKEI